MTRATPPRRSAAGPGIYGTLAQLYDRVYSFKDYDAEARELRRLIREFGPKRPRTLLDVGCGTGAHLVPLARHFEVTGVDASPEMLRIARAKLPNVPFYRARMERLRLDRKFDVVTCLFSAIGYQRTVAGLRATMGRLAEHTTPGGLVLVEPWIAPDQFRSGHTSLLAVHDPDLQIARMSRGVRRGTLSVLEMSYLVGDSNGIRSFHERHTLGLYRREEMRSAFVAAGLGVRFLAKGLMGRGLYLGRAPATVTAESGPRRTRG